MIYEYQCRKCGKLYEIITNDYDKTTDTCECGYIAERIMSKNTFKLRGVGWYGNSTSDYSTEDINRGVKEGDNRD